MPLQGNKKTKKSKLSEEEARIRLQHKLLKSQVDQTNEWLNLEINVRIIISIVK